MPVQYNPEDLAKALLNLDLNDCSLETLARLSIKIHETISDFEIEE